MSRLGRHLGGRSSHLGRRLGLVIVVVGVHDERAQVYGGPRRRF
jgi:hypothetical protein